MGQLIKIASDIFSLYLASFFFFFFFTKSTYSTLHFHKTAEGINRVINAFMFKISKYSWQVQMYV